MNKRRLLKLADLLEADAKNKKGIKFDMGTWASPSGSIWQRTWETKQNEIKVDCGTTACAVGLACISGAFARSGLTYGYKKGWTSGFALVPEFHGLRELPAVQRFFDLNEPESRFLFSGNEYPNNKTEGAIGERYVAKRIRDFVAGKGAPKVSA